MASGQISAIWFYSGAELRRLQARLNQQRKRNRDYRPKPLGESVQQRAARKWQRKRGSI